MGHHRSRGMFSNRTISTVNRVVRALAALSVATLLASADASGQSLQSIQLHWTAPGDDGYGGRAAAYEMRYSVNPIANRDTLAWWTGASSVGTIPAPQTSGSSETFTVAGLDSGDTYYFVIVTRDDVSLVSGYSNVAVRQAVGTGGGVILGSPAEISGYPNPARGQVTFLVQGGSSDGAPGRARVVVYDLSGHLICQLLDDVLPPSGRTVIWNCRAASGSPVAPGLYNVILDGPAGRKVMRVAIVP